MYMNRGGYCQSYHVSQSEQQNIHRLITSAQNVYNRVILHLGNNLTLPEKYRYNHPCVICVNSSFTCYLFTTFHVEVRGNIVMVKKELTPGGNGIY